MHTNRVFRTAKCVQFIEVPSFGRLIRRYTVHTSTYMSDQHLTYNSRCSFQILFREPKTQYSVCVAFLTQGLCTDNLVIE